MIQYRRGGLPHLKKHFQIFLLRVLVSFKFNIFVTIQSREKVRKYHEGIEFVYVYIYIYIYVCVCVCVSVFWQHFFVNTNFIKHNRHFMPTYFLLDPFEFPYYFYRIRGELIYVLSIVVCIPSTFCPTLGHHQEMIYYIHAQQHKYGKFSPTTQQC